MATTAAQLITALGSAPPSAVVVIAETSDPDVGMIVYIDGNGDPQPVASLPIHHRPH